MSIDPSLRRYRDASGDGVAWYRLTDLVRATLSYRHLDALYNGVRVVVEHFGADLMEFNDRYQSPLGDYRDIQMVIRYKDAASGITHMVELQLSTEPMLRAKSTTGHRDFEVVRELKAAVAEGNLGRVVNALEFGREHLGSEAGSGPSALGELLRSPAASTLIHDAAMRGHADIVHSMLQHGANVNAQNGNGDTPIHLAVFHGHERCVWVLLNVGEPDLDIENNEGQ